MEDGRVLNLRAAVERALDEALGEVPVVLRLGLSGGVDSIVLLDLLVPYAARRRHALQCVHVHHGLSPNADEWAAFCGQAAERYGVSCEVVRVDLRRYSGLGTEAAAREARYEALSRGAPAADPKTFLVLAHHRNDQAETLLLQLARGAGVAGLGAMPPMRNRIGTPAMLRPMLNVSRAEIVAYATGRGLSWIEDESNADLRFARNRVRAEVLPALERLNPAAVANIARSASHLREAQALLDELALLDARGAAIADRLDLAPLRRLDEARGRNVLRWWLTAAGCVPPSTAELKQLLHQLLHARPDARISIRLGDRIVRRYRGEALLETPRLAPPADFVARWQGERDWALPELGGSLHFEAVSGRGLRADLLRPSAVVVRLRRGGERFRPRPGGPQRSLKNLLQEQGVAPHERVGLPLLYCGDELAFVPYVGIAPHLAAGAEENGMQVEWRPAYPESRL